MRSRNRKDYDIHGNVHFVTSTVVGFVNVFNHSKPCDIFVECLRFCQARKDFTVLAWVLMPNHFHLIVKRAQEKTISEIVGNLKRYTARQIGQLHTDLDLKKTISRSRYEASRESAKGSGLWKPRFDSLVIMSENILRQKIEYIHFNPVRKRLVDEPWKWYYSSASMYAGREGIDLPVDSEWRCIRCKWIPSGRDS